MSDNPHKKVYIFKTKPLNFKEELDFLKTIPINTVVNYNPLTVEGVIKLWHVLKTCTHDNWDIVGTHTSVDKFILRYYGSGENVPSRYGKFDKNVTIAIIDLKRQGVYHTYCLRNKIYHVYNNGYRSGD